MSVRSILTAAAAARKEYPYLLDAPFSESISDLSGMSDITLVGYQDDTSPIVEFGGGKALRVNANQGVIFDHKRGKRFLTGDNWYVELELAMINPAAFKHEAILVFRETDHLDSYKLYLWKRYHASNRLIVNTETMKAETVPAVADTTTMSGGTWRKIRIQYNSETGFLQMLSNGVMVSQRELDDDFACDRLELLARPSPNFFNGYIRNLKVGK